MRINELQLRRVIRRLIGEDPLVDLPTGATGVRKRT